MIEHVEHRQFGFFAPNTHLEPEPDMIGRLLEAFRGKSFIPTTIQELGIGGPALRTRLQLQFTSLAGEWNLAFEPSRVLLKKQNVPGTEIGSAEDFSKEAVEVFRRLLEVTPFIGSRLSYVTSGLLPEMSSEELREASSRVVNPLPFYTAHPPHQWTTRNVARIDVSLRNESETLNVITDINRIQATLAHDAGPVPVDRIQIGFDINTYQQNTDLRFDAEHVGLFLQEAITQSYDILEQVEGRLNG